MKILRHRTSKTVTEHFREFQRCDDSRSGFMFPCKADGTLRPADNPDAARNLAGCLDGTIPAVDCGVLTMTHSYTCPAVGRCGCGASVVLDGFTNTCPHCGADYNSAGQLLAPREQWGEETGESVADILAAGGDLC